MGWMYNECVTGSYQTQEGEDAGDEKEDKPSRQLLYLHVMSSDEIPCCAQLSTNLRFYLDSGLRLSAGFRRVQERFIVWLKSKLLSRLHNYHKGNVNGFFYGSELGRVMHYLSLIQLPPTMTVDTERCCITFCQKEKETRSPRILGNTSPGSFLLKIFV